MIWFLGCGTLSLLYCVIKYFCTSHQVESLPSHSTFISMPIEQKSKEEVNNFNPFQSGLWSSRYFQHGKWHELLQFPLTFYPQSTKVTGSGSDNIGSFTVNGMYSIQTRRISLTKEYLVGTGNPKENFGHSVIIQLTWNAEKNQLEGRWYMIKPKCDNGEFKLRFCEQLSNV
jgi:hypothetical protein